MSESRTNVEWSGPDRRTIVKGAAWSVPVIAAAVGAPGASASPGGDWNVSVSAGCLLGTVGIGLLPGFTISETAAATPPATLTFVETYRTEIPLAWAGGGVGETAANVLSDTVHLALATVYLVAGAVGAASPGVSLGSWGSVSVTDENRVQGGFPAFAGSKTRVYTATRTVTVTGLAAGEAKGYGYLVSVAAINLEGLTPVTNYTLAAVSGSGGANPSDDAATLENDTLLGSCN